MRRTLDNIGIATATDFLFASEEDLGKTAILTPERAEQIKRVSVMRLDLDPQAPRAMDLDLFPSWLEKGLVTFEKIDKAMSKRWISSVWDFFATKDKEFLFIGGFFEKVLYMEKFRLVQSAKKLGFLENKLHRLGSLDWITPEIEKEFKGKGIAAKAEFMLKFNNEIYGKSGFDNFLQKTARQRKRFPLVDLAEIVCFCQCKYLEPLPLFIGNNQASAVKLDNFF